MTTALLIGPGMAYGAGIPSDHISMSKFTAVATGSMTFFQVFGGSVGNVKCALYADSGGEPGALITAMNTGQAVIYGVNSLSFTSTNIISGTDYWLAVNIDTTAAVEEPALAGNTRAKDATYSGFSFPDPAGSGYTAYTSSRINAAGWGELAVAPTVETHSPATSIEDTTAYVEGHVTADGGATVTDRGICYNTTGTPTTVDPHVHNGSGTGTFNTQLTDLTGSITYHSRAFAINAVGTSYGDEVDFRTIKNNAEIPKSVIKITPKTPIKRIFKKFKTIKPKMVLSCNLLKTFIFVKLIKMVLEASQSANQRLSRILSSFLILISSGLERDTAINIDIKNYLILDSILSKSINMLNSIKFFMELISAVSATRVAEFVLNLVLNISDLSRAVNLSSIFKVQNILKRKFYKELEELITRMEIIPTKYKYVGMNRFLATEGKIEIIIFNYLRRFNRVISAIYSLLSRVDRRFQDIEVIIASALYLICRINTGVAETIKLIIKLRQTMLKLYGRYIIMKASTKMLAILARIKKHKGMKWLKFREYIHEEYR